METAPPNVLASLRLVADRGSSELLRVGRHAVLLGRDRGCDVCLVDPKISRHHALVWFHRDRLHVRDLGSALGTWVGPRQLGPGEACPAEPGEEITLAKRATLVWGPPVLPAGERWLPEIVWLREGGRWLPAQADGNVSAHGEAEDDSGETLLALPVDWGVEQEGHCRLTVAVERGAPQTARFEGRMGVETTIAGESRVVLLFLLARQRLLYDSGRTETPWLDDYELRVGLWGSRASELPASRLNTLVTRIRDQLQATGLPRDVVEKRSGATRLGPAIERVVVEGWTRSRMPAVP